MPLEDLEKEIGFKLGDNYIIATFHPVTTQPGDEARQTKALLDSLSDIIKDGWKVLFTMPNSDTGGKTVANLIKDWASQHPRSVKAVTSLGRLKYYSAMRYAAAVVGNSSSGLIEAPSFGIPTLNIGDRQKGRAQGDSVVNCGVTKDEISEGLKKVLSDEFRSSARNAINPYEKEGTLQSILQPLIHAPLPSTKTFHDLH